MNSLRCQSRLKKFKNYVTVCVELRNCKLDPPPKLNNKKLIQLKKQIIKPTPSQQRYLSKQSNVSQFAICRSLKKLHLECVKKPKVPACYEKYLRGQRFKTIITSDEALFYWWKEFGQRSIQYISRVNRNFEAEHHHKKLWCEWEYPTMALPLQSL
ncbi:hypothetical protein ILUMI_19560 [Ignelater luminosus]|uniref:Transposase n=1 Tax=Ignelater luminosus TaxID=2038154 RepID=A0A8K0CFY5_IGNLU|nr:hypothetical protein ILUMI_19560 [Ignelater luminosus]